MEHQVIMNHLSYPILSVLIFLPVLGALLILILKRSWELLAKSIALVTSIATFLLSIPLFTEFDKTTHKMQFAEHHSWIPNWNIHYFLGVDGISILLVLLSTLTAILCVLISWESITKKVKEFYIAILLTTAFMIGVFCSLDFFLFYLFWEAMLIPMFLIIGVWGGPNRVYAAIKFFLYTLVGSVLMLVGIIVLYLHAGRTFNIPELMTNTYPYSMQLWLFWAFFAAFAVKVPMWPVHTWLPDAHTEAPTDGSVILVNTIGHCNHLWRSHLPCPDRFEAAYRLQFREPHGLRDPRDLCPEYAGGRRRHSPDDQSRYRYRSSLSLRGHCI